MQDIPLISTAYLPPVAYMAVLARHGEVAIEEQESFPKQTLRNRCVIAAAGGPLVLSVPVVRPEGNHTLTGQMLVSYQEPWHIRHWRAIVSAYSAAPYFLYYRDGLEQILMQRHERLIDLNDALLRYLLQKMKIDCHLTYTTDYRPARPGEEDLRVALTDKHASPAVGDMEHGGMGAGISPYPQVFADRLGFLPNLTAIDLLFNLGPESRDMLLR